MRSVSRMQHDLFCAGFSVVEMRSVFGDAAVFRVEDHVGRVDFAVAEGRTLLFYETLEEAESAAREMETFSGFRAGGEDLEKRRTEWLAEELAYLEV